MLNSKSYNFFKGSAIIRWGVLAVLTLLALASASTLSFKENIEDFLPLSPTEKLRMAVTSDVSGLNQLFVIFEPTDSALSDPDRIVQAIDAFAKAVDERDTEGWTAGMLTEVDAENLSRWTDFIYGHLPLFLTQADYARMDSLLGSEGFIPSKLDEAAAAMMFPSGGLAEQFVGRDPLGLFAPILEDEVANRSLRNCELYEGHVFTPGFKKAIVTLSSPFAGSETGQNAQLVGLLESSIRQMQHGGFPDIKAHVAGGPEVAVGNARQIMHDSLLAVAISAVLIVGILLASFRNLRDILLIALSVLWGWLASLGAIALVRDDISMIAVGISSIIVGIAVNYPLHLISHVRHSSHGIREAVREVRTPLLVGNVTTVAAFLALVPLRSSALSDLGLFASFLLIGTILFVLVWLPMLLKQKAPSPLPLWGSASLPQPPRLAGLRHSPKGGAGRGLLLLTLLFGYYSLRTEFDANVAHINYMSPEQKEDIRWAEELLGRSDGDAAVTLYLLSSAPTYREAILISEKHQSTIDSLLEAGIVKRHRGTARLLPSVGEGERRINLWHDWLQRHPSLLRDVQDEAEKHGFEADAFSGFARIVEADYAPLPFERFDTLTSVLLRNHLSDAMNRRTIVETLNVGREHVAEVEAALPEAFDVALLHDSVARALSDDFNYIGLVCSSVVFLFLWLSFRRIELAVIAFIPMAVSWIWILGIMQMLGIKFNIVSIILATFIFGQGDDYTIFMTEGSVSEYIHGRRVLTSYRRSIILSALIMFIGIGSLIFSRHPALHSLAEVTIIGMACVVMMAMIIPPMLIKWLIRLFPKRFKNL